LDEIEKEILGVTHADVGHDVLAHWKLPSLYEESIWCHHAPVQVIDDEQYKISGIVNIANTLTHMTCIGSSGNRYPRQVKPALLKKFSLSTDVLNGLMESVPKQIDIICDEIGIGKPTEGLFGLINRASIRLSEISIKLQHESVQTNLARKRSDILLQLLKELNNTSKISDALARASEALFQAGLIKGFIGGFKFGEHNLVFEHRQDGSPRFIKVGDAEVKTMVLNGGYTAGMSLPWGVFVHMDISDPEIGDDQEFISSLVGSISSSLRRIHAETALQQEKTLLRQALKATSHEKQKSEDLAHLNRELMDASTFGLCLVDDKNQVRIENAMSSELRGLLGITDKDILSALDASNGTGYALLKEALVSRTPKDVTWNTEGRSFRITIRPILANNWALLALWDITGELEEQKRTLAFAKMSVVGSLAASMAHNMKSPLGAIHGFTSIIRDDLKHEKIRVLRNNEEDQDLPDMLSNISTASENLLKIVNQLLNFTRKWESPEGEVGLEGFIEGIFQLIGAQANAAGVTLVREVEPVQVRMKAEAIEQVIINIMINAINASSRGSQILVKAHRKDDCVAFSVIDYGIGMNNDQIKKIYEPLYTAWPLKTGMGLGLSLAREIVESLGGKIQVSSKLAEGSTFTVWIPEGKGY
jgi:signal transduction histidine kinase